MNTCNFYLASYIDKKNEARIAVKIGKKYERLPWSVPIKDWNKSKQQANKTYEHWFVLNSNLNSLKNHVANYFIQHPNASLHTAIEDFFNNNHETDVMTIADCMKLGYEVKKSIVAETRLRVYRVILREIIKAGMGNIPAAEFSVTHLNQYIKWLIKRDISNNTIFSKISQMRALLYAYSRTYKKFNFDFFKDTEKPNTYEADMIAHTEEELQALYDLQLSERTEVVRDAYLFSCYTGARFGDIKALSIKTDIKNNMWHLRTEKTRDIIKIPFNNRAKEIIQKYKDINHFPLSSNQKVNKMLKKICENAGINSEIRKRGYSGSSTKNEIFPKYEMVGFHTARRTFITLSLTKGINAEIIMKISGHKKHDTFKKYIKFSDKQISEEFLKKWE